MRVFLIGLFAVIVGPGCSSLGTTFTRSDIDKLVIGKTTEQDVRAQFGDPITETSWKRVNQNSTFYLYGINKIVTGHEIQVRRKTLKLEFVHELLNGYMYNNSLDDSSTNFDGMRISELVLHQTTKKQALQIFGNEFGRIRFPSHMLEEAHPGPLTISPSNQEVEALVYLHSYYAENGGFSNEYKMLVMTFDSHDILVGFRYMDSNSPRVYFNSAK